MIYVLHFDRPLSHARHYTGYVKSVGGLERRLAEHAAGRGARLMEVIAERGIGWTLARVMEGGRNKERQIKRSGNVPRSHCPLCKGRPKGGEVLVGGDQHFADLIEEA